MHLALDERIDLVVARLLFPYKTQCIPIGLQRTSGTEAVLPFPQEPVEEGIQNVDGNAFEGGYGILLSILAVSGNAD